MPLESSFVSETPLRRRESILTLGLPAAMPNRAGPLLGHIAAIACLASSSHYGMSPHNGRYARKATGLSPVSTTLLDSTFPLALPAVVRVRPAWPCPLRKERPPCSIVGVEHSEDQAHRFSNLSRATSALVGLGHAGAFSASALSTPAIRILSDHHRDPSVGITQLSRTSARTAPASQAGGYANAVLAQPAWSALSSRPSHSRTTGALNAFHLAIPCTRACRSGTDTKLSLQHMNAPLHLVERAWKDFRLPLPLHARIAPAGARWLAESSLAVREKIAAGSTQLSSIVWQQHG